MTRVVLETPRLSLRELTLDDAGLMLAIWTDAAFVRNVADRGIRTLEQAQTAMRDGPLRLYEDYGYGPFRVALKACDTPIGICGLFRREGLDVPDIGYALLPDYYSNGYMIEASKRVLQFARDERGIGRLLAIVAPNNGASVRLLKKLGLEFERMIRLPGDEQDLALYSIDFD